MVHFFVENAANEVGQFRVAGEAQRDQLVDGELRDARLQIRWQHLFEAQAHFEANDAILHGERKEARVEGDDNQGDGEQYGDHSVERKSQMDDAVDLVNQVQKQNGKRDQVEGRHHPRMIREILLFHGTPPPTKYIRWD